ncbi:NAD(P)/FAD-dependent oxidoreductase [Haloferax gibbonsii]|uniref:NADH dehydrogenase n=1 Tax=Haloferax gibbonsii TaxID=35746 RepID=A0A0K1IY15_HALGI|nr:FAD-dependent oxidoreductase [Haloferax gibbonsii]AKU09344.1 NADH dehydrogenase [Haloferax gibbonsii]
MVHDIVILGAGYAGTSAVQYLEQNIGDRDVNLTWVNNQDYHLILHEVHRVIRNPDSQQKVTIPIRDIKGPATQFVEGHVEAVNTAEQTVSLTTGTEIPYDYLLVALGSQTAYYGIPGLDTRAHTLKSLEDALSIHQTLIAHGQHTTMDRPAQIIIGGAGLSGVQTAGEIATLRDEADLPLDIHLVEAQDSIMPGHSPSLQESVRRALDHADVTIHTADPITRAETDRIQFASGDSLEYDLFIWTGGITGRDAMAAAAIDTEHNRAKADATFQTSDDRVFAIGDAALVDVDGSLIPPTAQAAWQAAETAAENLLRSIAGQPLKTWAYTDKGTLISVGEATIAHDVEIVPIDTFGSYPAKFLKKFIAARWIADLTSWPRALKSWDAL